MKKTLLIFLIVAFVVLIGAVVFRFTLMPSFMSSLQKEKTEKVSEAVKIKDITRVAGDDYIGYWFIKSSEFKQRFAQKGYGIQWTNDGGDYEDRLKKFKEGKYDLIVLPVNSYILHGKPDPYPGLIVAALSDSKGADMIVGYKDKITSEDRPLRVNDLNDPNLKIGATNNSPSSFLLNCATVYFDLDEIKAKAQRYIGTNSSEEALKKLTNREVDVAVLWEPNVSQALQIPGVVSIFGSDQISGMIIDVFVAKNEALISKPEMVDAFFEAYFETLVYYGENRDEMISQMARTTAFKSEDAVKVALNRIAWFDLQENGRDWFSVDATTPGDKEEKIIRTIIQVRDVMMDIGELSSDPIQGNPYKIISSKVLEKLYTKSLPEASKIGAIVPTATAFSVMSDADWNKLKSVGTLKTLPVTFDSSTARLTFEGAQMLDQAATLLNYNFPQYRVLVKGHTAPSNDEAANVALSQERADMVINYLVQVHGIPQERIRATGLGSAEPLPREKNEAERAYRNRLARVEFILLEDKK